jgi:hypothetical protein
MEFYYISQNTNFNDRYDLINLIDFVTKDNIDKLVDSVYNFVLKFISTKTYFFTTIEAKIKNLYNKCNCTISNRTSDIAILKRAEVIRTSIYIIWVNVQDAYAINKFEDGKINIMYTGSAHNINMEKFFTDVGFHLIYESKPLGVNCVEIENNFIKSDEFKCINKKLPPKDAASEGGLTKKLTKYCKKYPKRCH